MRRAGSAHTGTHEGWGMMASLVLKNSGDAIQGALQEGTPSDGKVLISQGRFITGTHTCKPESLSRFATEMAPGP